MWIKSILPYLIPSFFAGLIVVLPRYIIILLIYRQLDDAIAKKKDEWNQK